MEKSPSILYNQKIKIAFNFIREIFLRIFVFNFMKEIPKNLKTEVAFNFIREIPFTKFLPSIYKRNPFKISKLKLPSIL